MMYPSNIVEIHEPNSFLEKLFLFFCNKNGTPIVAKYAFTENTKKLSLNFIMIFQFIFYDN